MVTATRTKTRAQIALDERIVENPELLEMLENRQELKQYVSDYRKADKETKAKIIASEEIPPYRVGRFIISKQTVAPKSVAFETNEGTRISIKTIDED